MTDEQARHLTRVPQGPELTQDQKDAQYLANLRRLREWQQSNPDQFAAFNRSGGIPSYMQADFQDRYPDSPLHQQYMDEQLGRKLLTYRGGDAPGGFGDYLQLQQMPGGEAAWVNINVPSSHTQQRIAEANYRNALRQAALENIDPRRQDLERQKLQADIKLSEASYQQATDPTVVMRQQEQTASSQLAAARVAEVIQSVGAADNIRDQNVGQTTDQLMNWMRELQAAEIQYQAAGLPSSPSIQNAKRLIAQRIKESKRYVESKEVMPPMTRYLTWKLPAEVKQQMNQDRDQVLKYFNVK